MSHDYFITSSSEAAVPIIAVCPDEFTALISKQNNRLKNWLQVNDFKAESGSICLLPDRDGKIKKVFLGIENSDDFWAFAALPNKLASGVYQIQLDCNTEQLQRIAIAWGLGTYKFTVYKKEHISKAQLLLSGACDLQYVESVVSSIALVRDLINYPAENMGPISLAKAATSVAIEFGAKVDQVIGDDLLKKGFAGIHAVGRGSSSLPRLIDLTWGKKKDPQLVLIGKGVCFDSGGLDIKPREYMLGMEKDMGGAAHVLGLARMIMAAKLPVNLRVLIPAVENMVSGNSYKPGDIITTYKGTTVEVGDTDAEGRLVLADALALACEPKPDLIIDFATLTGSASAALGTEIAAMFTVSNNIAEAVSDVAEEENDPVWQMPLYKPYKDLLDSHIADIRSCGSVRCAGAITAALFLQEFISKDQEWVHFDISDNNEKDRPGRPKGGEAHGLRALFSYLVKRYG